MSLLLILMYRHVVNTKRSKEMALEDPASVVEMASKKVSWCHGRPFVFSRLELPPPKDLLVSDSWGIPAIPTFVWSASSLDALRVENSKICEVWTAPFPTPTSCSKNPSNIGGWQSHWACRNQRSGCPGPIVASTNQREGSTSVAPFRKGAPYATAQPESSQFGWQCSACLDWPHEALKKGEVVVWPWWYRSHWKYAQDIYKAQMEKRKDSTLTSSLMMDWCNTTSEKSSGVRRQDNLIGCKVSSSFGWSIPFKTSPPSTGTRMLRSWRHSWERWTTTGKSWSSAMDILLLIGRGSIHIWYIATIRNRRNEMVIPISEFSVLCRIFVKNTEKDQSELLFTEI